jgi:uncharacterized protein YbjQ (UPF0145 family)
VRIGFFVPDGCIIWPKIQENEMPQFAITTKNNHGLIDTVFEEFDSEDAARTAFEKGWIDPLSGVTVKFEVLNIEVLTDKYFEEKEEKVKKIKSERLKAAQDSGDFSALTVEEIQSATQNIIVTTSYEVANREVEIEIDIITAETVFGMNMFKDFFAGVRDIVGGRSAATQKVLRDARRTALAELKREALIVGADAVIAIDLDYQEISGGGKEMIMIVASGTAVKLKGK